MGGLLIELNKTVEGGLMLLKKKLYCPLCGKQKFNHGGIGKNCLPSPFLCGECGFEFYFNVAAAVGGIIETEKGILFALRRNDPKKGMYDLPGGFLDYQETGEEAVIREIYEELNI